MFGAQLVHERELVDTTAHYCKSRKFRCVKISVFRESTFQLLEFFGICSSSFTHCVGSNRFFEVFKFRSCFNLGMAILYRNYRNLKKPPKVSASTVLYCTRMHSHLITCILRSTCTRACHCRDVVRGECGRSNTPLGSGVVLEKC